ncbi:hypothetical protein MTR62_04035 [Novosphingobium sp. 1949]|uniref:Uncharacterized protein n=1 Tax=Novosphingobium organovorum TaxID=2930092 RepID=A0ABT0BAQ5_9SPHN|nr:hypothetical protein [Novosphingobium organovorum]MCJ2181874.1 hypothetical protein [Novosphingobium organovorum]
MGAISRRLLGALGGVVLLGATCGVPMATAKPASTPDKAASKGAIAFKPGKSWKHPETGQVFPPMLAGFTLREVRDLSESRSDIAVVYRDESGSALLSVFYFRAGLPDVSIWQDRILTTIARNMGGWGKVGEEPAQRASFSPVNGVPDSGALLTVALDGSQAYATGSAILSDGTWLLALRMTSRRFTQSQLTNHLLDAIAALPLPAAAATAPIGPSYVIEPCPQTPPQADAPRSIGAQGEAIAVALMASLAQDHKADTLEVADDPAAGASSGARRYCREDADGPNYSVYSNLAARNEHVIALDDAGSAVMLQSGPADLSAPDGGLIFTPTLRTAETTRLFRGFTASPSFAQMIAVVSNESPIASVGRTPKTQRDIAINPDVLDPDSVAEAKP